MAHELAHLSQRHFARGHRSPAAHAGAGDGCHCSPASWPQQPAPAMPGHCHHHASTQAAAIQEQRRFSRQNEQEADRIGLLNLEKAGYDPRAMPSMFERLMRQYRYDRKPPEFLLTHPVSESRIADTRNRAEQFQRWQASTDSLRYQLLRARVQLIFEETPGIAAKRFRAMLEENPQLDAARYGLAIAQDKGRPTQRSALRAAGPLLAKAPEDITYNLAHGRPGHHQPTA